VGEEKAGPNLISVSKSYELSGQVKGQVKSTEEVGRMANRNKPLSLMKGDLHYSNFEGNVQESWEMR